MNTCVTPHCGRNASRKRCGACNIADAGARMRGVEPHTEVSALDGACREAKFLNGAVVLTANGPVAVSAAWVKERYP